ncbi:hypothetical protein Nepgr_018278 [Nepenthes gracilis]|uniref:Rab-GAP TBC domain-containing protein n=1 Tax=Nepenthes gracilis TaxID=150966 RepID=A0AAD3XSY0_NEPGR|nr:hypothetical protein Nepgr_018278 [Nepenthes gracilis]
MSPAPIVPMLPEASPEADSFSRFSDLRSVRWRINLGILPSSVSCSIDNLRRVTADSRRRYAVLRRHLFIDPHVSRDGSSSPGLVMDNPLSQNPDSLWGRFFRNAELEKMVDQDLSRLYPEHGSYFQTTGCQGMLRRILLLWCLRYPEYGYRQGMHELLAPLLYVLHTDLQRLFEVRSTYEDYFTDKFDDALFHESDLTYNFDFKKSLDPIDDDNGFKNVKKVISLEELDPNIQTIVLLSDAYGAEGELGIVLSEKFLEHDAYCMFDALMSGAGGAVAMAEFFSHSPAGTSQTGLPSVIEASLALYHLLSIVDSSLHSHLVELGVEPQYFSLRWLRVLFGREFLLEDLLVIWDEIFSFDNSKSVKTAETDVVSSFGVLNSQRGAFISAMAVSMLLNVRCSLLATEHATSCLQRLLSFPENVDLNKLIGKAKSLLPIALRANYSSFPCPVTAPYNQVKSMVMRGHSLSFDSISLKTPISSAPERYWEEKWRVLHKEEEHKEGNSAKQASTQKKGWTQKVKLRLSRTESDSSSSKRASREKDHNHKSSVRRSLLEDLTQQLQLEEDTEETNLPESFCHKDPLHAESVTGVEHVQENLAFIEKTYSGQSTASEENSPIFPDPLSPVSGSNGLENDSKKSSFTSNISCDVDNGERQMASRELSISAELPLPVLDPPYANMSVSTRDNSYAEPYVMDSKERKSFSAELLDNDHEKKSFTSNISQDVNDGEPQKIDREPSISEEVPLPVSDPPDANMSLPACDNSSAEPSIIKERKSFSGKFNWLRKFGRQASGEGTSVKGAAAVGTKSTAGGSHHNTANEQSYCPVNLKGDGDDQNLIYTLRSLGQSMLENIQVVESAFQQDNWAGAQDNSASKNPLVEKGQVSAMAALKELRKISNILSEM